MRIYEDQYIVITGGAGFIGSSLIRYFNDKGLKNLIIVDDLGTSEKWKNLVGKKFVDIIPIHAFFTWLKDHVNQVEACIHLGANSSTIETNADLLLETNYRYTQNLCKWCIDYNIRFIYASSAATYGNGFLGFSDDESTLNTMQPLNMYGYSKQLFDLWAQEMGLLNQIVGLKYFNLYGPNEWHKGRMSSVIPKFVKQIQERGFVELFKSSEPEKYGDGDQLRDFLYVKDAVKMTAAFLEKEVCGIFNIGSGVPHSWNQVARATFQAMNLPIQIKYIDMPADLLGKYQNYTVADMQKTKKALGNLAMSSDLDVAIDDYVKNHLLMEKTW